MSKKLKLKDLREKTHTFEIVHPKLGKTGYNITIRSTNCDDYFYKQLDLYRKYESNTEASLKEKAQDSIALLSKLVVAWDNEFFDDMECTYDNVVTQLTPIEMGWLRDQIATEVANSDNFFPNS